MTDKNSMRFDFGQANDEQKKAIQHIDGPALIIAGPGTGKTFTLVKRVVYLIVEKGVKPENILIATFTEKAAKELITRITNELIRLNINVNINELYIGTIHSICLRLIKENVEFTRLKKNYRLMDEFDQKYMIYRNHKIFDEIPNLELIADRLSPWEKSKQLAYYFNAISEEMITVEDLLKDNDAAVQVLARAYEVYLKLLDEENAMKKAAEIDEKLAKGEELSPLAGIPVGIKDNISTKGLRTTCASKMLEYFVPPYDATVIKKLQAEDAILIGKTNLDEFAMGSSTENSAMKVTKNPIDITRVPGGSSGGSAAAVGSEMVPLALGSDTGGSIRQPASFCGIVGMKPTYGLVSRFGLVAFGSSLDQIGPFSMNVEDNAYLLNIIAGEDDLDCTTKKGLEKVDYTKELGQDISGMKIGIPKEFIEEKGLDSEIKDIVLKDLEALKELGCEVEEFSLPSTKDGLAPYYIISSAEASSNLARFNSVSYGYRAKDYTSVDDMIEKSRSEGFGKEVKRRIMLGTYALSSGYYDAYYNKAQKFRTKLKDEFKEAFKKYDIILGPVSPILPFKIGERCEDPTAMYLADIYTININLATVPALSMPGGKSKEGLPVGIQLIGDTFSEDKIYKVAYQLEKKLALQFDREV